MSVAILNADARAVPLANSSVDCVVTSPPYWGLRDYGTARWEGGDPDCEHLGAPVRTREGFNERYFAREAAEGNKQDALRAPHKAVCSCGAVRFDRQIGLEATPEAFVETMAAVFREVKRVLKPSGTLWLNLGDCYSDGSRDRKSFRRDRAEVNPRKRRVSASGLDGCGRSQAAALRADEAGRTAGIGPKQLMGMPWRVAFALQAEGWFLRSDIIWAKPNPMPESVTDRPTRAHEYLFLFSPSQRYFYDADAIRERATSARARASSEGHRGKKMRSDEPESFGLTRGTTNQTCSHPGGRNKRDVWSIPSQPYPEAHFATFPEALVEPCIKAGCPANGVVLDPFGGRGRLRGWRRAWAGRRCYWI